jgi:Ni/Co efflux regulator RcnB
LNRRHLAISLIVAALSLPLPSLHAATQGNSGEHGHKNDRDDDDHGDRHHDEHGNGHAYGHDKHQRYFRDQDSAYLTRYYDGPRNLPPGQRKKYYRDGTLPPGWQARFRPMPTVVIQQLPPVPYGYQRGYYDGYAVIVDPRTRIIFDAIDIVGALNGH